MPRSEDLPSAAAVERVALAAARARGEETFTADDLRRACHQLTLGRCVSSKSLTARECDRVVAYFRLLANPDDVASVRMLFEQPAADRKRMLWVIEHTGLTEEYLAAVSRDRHGTWDWRSLADADLRHFVVTCTQRAAAMRRRAAEQMRIARDAVANVEVAA